MIVVMEKIKNTYNHVCSHLVDVDVGHWFHESVVVHPLPGSDPAAAIAIVKVKMFETSSNAAYKPTPEVVLTGTSLDISSMKRYLSTNSQILLYVKISLHYLSTISQLSLNYLSNKTCS